MITPAMILALGVGAATPTRFNVLDYGAVGGDGLDDTAGFQAAVDAACAAPAPREVLIPAGVYDLIAAAPTLRSPKRVLITCDDIVVRGVGRPLVRMKGIDKAHLDELDDPASSGRDLFTAFSFRRSRNCGIEGIRFEGTWDGVGTFRYASPRAKGVGFVGTTDCHASQLYGERILGNLVNATPSDATFDGAYRPLRRLRIHDSHAYLCLESGFNSMGNTFDVQLTASSAQFCGSAGFESGSTGYVASGNIFRHNKFAGISIGGTNGVVVGNVIDRNGHYVKSDGSNGESVTPGAERVNGAGVVVSAGSAQLVEANVIRDNDGIGCHVYPGVKDLTFASNTLGNNGSRAAYRYAVYAVGTDKRIARLRVSGNTMTSPSGTESAFLLAARTDDLVVDGNSVLLPAAAQASIVVATDSRGAIVRGNDVDRPIAAPAAVTSENVVRGASSRMEGEPPLPAARQSAGIRATAAWDQPPIVGQGCADHELAVPGAAEGAECVASAPSTLPATLWVGCYVPRHGIARFRFCNPTPMTSDPPAATYGLRVFNP